MNKTYKPPFYIYVFLIIAITLISSCLSNTSNHANAATPLTEQNETADLIFIGDSWTAYAGQSGQAGGGCVFPIFTPTFTGLPTGTCPYVPALGYSCYGGCGLVTPNTREGLSTEGLVRDRLNARGIPYSKIIKHEGAIGGSHAWEWADAIPNDLNPSGVNTSFWPPSIISAIQNPTSYRPIVWMTIGGNDLFPYGTQYHINDDTNWDNAMATIQTDIDKIIRFLIALNPAVEIVLPSYTNFKIVDGIVSTFPQTGTYGFCRELFGANANGRMFYATTYPTYEDAAEAWAENRWNTVDYPSIYNNYVSSNMWRVPWNISLSGLQNEATNYTNSQKSNRISYYLSPISAPAGLNAYQQASVMQSAYSVVTEQGINPTIQRLDEVWSNLARTYSGNVKYFPVWTTISIDDVTYPQPINEYASAPRSLFSDCIHLNSDGYSKWVDRILDDWLPQSRYLSMR